MENLELLIAEDSETQRQYACGLCQSLGLTQVRLAEDGMQALIMMREQQPDVLLVDLEMPVLNGVDLIRQAAAEKLITNIIILSSKDPSLIASVGTMAAVDGLNVLGTLRKPLALDGLQSCLARYKSETTADAGTIERPLITREELVEALKQRQFILYYQPKLTLRGLLFNGVEALLRWQHPTKGLIPPMEFIPLAEEYGLIHEMTRQLLGVALAQTQIWQRRGLKLAMAVNLSPISLRDAELPVWAEQMAHSYGVSPDDITFEITETALIQELASAIQTLARLRLKGFKIAIDDYGTGFANAQYLSQVPATELKIDRSLVDKAAILPQRHAILASTVRLAQQLAMEVVAEGVETREDLAILRDLEVETVQGYLFARPMPASDINEWVSKDLSKLRKSFS